MTAKVLIKRTETPGVAPPVLSPGELAIEMNVPTRLWVGVPDYLDPSRRKLLLDTSQSMNTYTKQESDGRFVNVIGDTMSGDLSIAKASPALILAKTGTGQQNYILGYTGATARWQLDLGDAAPEGGGNTGSDFAIYSFNDAGAYSGSVLNFSRASGLGSVIGNPVAPLGIATKQYVDAVVGGIPPTDVGNFVQRTGDTMSGPLTINSNMAAYNVYLPDSQGSVIFGTQGHYIARIADTGRLRIGGGQDVVEIVNPLRVTNSAYVQADLTGAANISAAGAVNAGVSMYCGGDITANGNFQTANWVRCGDIDINNNADCRIFFRGLDYSVKGIVFQDNSSGHQPTMVMRNTFPGNDPNDIEADVGIHKNGMIQLGWGFMARAGYSGIFQYVAHNFYWDGSGCQVWVDNNNVGYTGNVSDYRTKKDVAPLPSMWDTVKALNPIRYTQREFSPPNTPKFVAWKDGDTPKPMFVDDANERWGFLAHELQETTIATAATGVKDSPDTIQSPNPFTVIAALTKALQEAMTRIEALEAKAA